MSLCVKEVCKEYQTAYGHNQVLQDLNLEIQKNEFVCITGRSGSGKSTLLNICAGILKPTSGTVLLDGEELYQKDDASLSRLRNETLGYILQGYSVFPNLTVLENVLLPFYMYRRTGEVSDYAEHLMEQVGIAGMKDRYPSQLSGGEVRRVAIARSLINRPKLVLADEPTSDLDKATTKDIMELFKQIQQSGVAVLMVTHDARTIEYADTHYEMEDGALQRV